MTTDDGFANIQSLETGKANPPSSIAVDSTYMRLDKAYREKQKLLMVSFKVLVERTHITWNLVFSACPYCIYSTE